MSMGAVVDVHKGQVGAQGEPHHKWLAILLFSVCKPLVVHTNKGMRWPAAGVPSAVLPCGYKQRRNF